MKRLWKGERTESWKPNENNLSMRGYLKANVRKRSSFLFIKKIAWISMFIFDSLRILSFSICILSFPIFVILH